MKNSLVKVVKFLRVEWFSLIVIAIATAAYSGIFIDFNIARLKSPKYLEVIGMAIVLSGTLWGLLGVVMNIEDFKKFECMITDKKYDMEAIVRAMLSASSFALTGAIVVIIGTIPILVKSIFFQ